MVEGERHDDFCALDDQIPKDDWVDSPTNSICSFPRNILLILCLSVTFIVNMLVSIVAPFFPVYAKAKFHATLAETGFIFAAFPTGILIFSPLWGYFSVKFGRLKVLVVGFIFFGAGTICFGLSKSITAFILSRLLQGFGGAGCLTAAFAMLNNGFQEDLGLVIGLAEATLGLGFIVGPAAGGALFKALGFERLFVFILGPIPFIFAGIVVITSFCVPAEFIAGVEGLGDTPLKKPPVNEILNGAFVSSGFILLFCSASLGFVQPILSVHLMRTLHVNEVQIWGLFAVPAVIYAVSAPFAGIVSDPPTYPQ
jgi:MFS family permease